MAWRIGIDEAGYGPNLGPLVVAATAWHVANDDIAKNEAPAAPPRTPGPTTATLPPSARVDLYRQLAHVVALKPAANRLAIADSKRLYKPGGGLQLLERAVLAALAVSGRRATCFDTLVEALAADPHDARRRLPWYEDFMCMLPLDVAGGEIETAVELLRGGCETANVGVAALRARLVYPREFNDLTRHHGTKGAALSHISIALLKEVIESLPPSPQPLTPSLYQITCDKHGGRNRYAALLQHHFPDHWIDTLEESRASSRYRWQNAESTFEVQFRTKGEAELPTALASMTAKYLRELAMRAFNAFWMAQIPQLRPTAGYPLDAKRFLSQIQARQCELKIHNGDLWRDR